LTSVARQIFFIFVRVNVGTRVMDKGKDSIYVLSKYIFTCFSIFTVFINHIFGPFSIARLIVTLAEGRGTLTVGKTVFFSFFFFDDEQPFMWLTHSLLCFCFDSIVVTFVASEAFKPVNS
jgi:hypothetical protein